jgi:hypothetical protein
MRSHGIAVCTLLALLAAAPARAQGGRPATNPPRRFSVQFGVGAHVYERGDSQQVAFGYQPHRDMTVLVTLQRDDFPTRVEYYSDGYAATRGGLLALVSGEFRYTVPIGARVAPHGLAGTGFGALRSDVNQFFPHRRDPALVHVFYLGGGATVRLHRRLDLLAMVCSWFTPGWSRTSSAASCQFAPPSPGGSSPSLLVLRRGGPFRPAAKRLRRTTPKREARRRARPPSADLKAGRYGINTRELRVYMETSQPAMPFACGTCLFASAEADVTTGLARLHCRHRPTRSISASTATSRARPASRMPSTGEDTRGRNQHYQLIPSLRRYARSAQVPWPMPSESAPVNRAIATHVSVRSVPSAEAIAALFTRSRRTGCCPSARRGCRASSCTQQASAADRRGSTRHPRARGAPSGTAPARPDG